MPPWMLSHMSPAGCAIPSGDKLCRNVEAMLMMRGTDEAGNPCTVCYTIQNSGVFASKCPPCLGGGQGEPQGDPNSSLDWWKSFLKSLLEILKMIWEAVEKVFRLLEFLIFLKRGFQHLAGGLNSGGFHGV